MSCVRSQGWGPARAPGPPPPPPRLEGAPRSTALRGVKFPIHPEATPSLRASQTCPRSSHLQTRFSFWLCPEGQDCWQQGPCSAPSLQKEKFGWPGLLAPGTGEGQILPSTALASLTAISRYQWSTRPAIVLYLVLQSCPTLATP